MADHKRLREALGKLTGKWLLSYDDCKEARELYQDYKVKAVSRENGINRAHIKNNTFKELLIKNY